MNQSKTPQSLLNEIAQIQQMERGKLSIIRESLNGPYFKLQAWEDGKNVSRYIPRDQAPAVQRALDGYQRFDKLTEQYAQHIIDQTRAEIAAGSKKKKFHPNSSSLKTPKSNS